MKKKVVANVILVLLLLSAAGGLVWSRTQKITSCDEKLKNFAENHACISTTRGLMVFELYPARAPKAVEVFKKLSNEDKFFNGLEFYRVVKDFVIQGGVQDLQIQSNGVTGFDDTIKKKFDLVEKNFDTEANFDALKLSEETKGSLEQEGFKSTPNLDTKPFEFGSISFANRGPNTNSTEIFIVTAKDKEAANIQSLNGKFTNFGQIVEGKEILEQLNGSELDVNNRFSDEKPAEPIKIIEIVTK